MTRVEPAVPVSETEIILQMSKYQRSFCFPPKNVIWNIPGPPSKLISLAVVVLAVVVSVAVVMLAVVVSLAVVRLVVV